MCPFMWFSIAFIVSVLTYKYFSHDRNRPPFIAIFFFCCFFWWGIIGFVLCFKVNRLIEDVLDNIDIRFNKD